MKFDTVNKLATTFKQMYGWYFRELSAFDSRLEDLSFDSMFEELETNDKIKAFYISDDLSRVVGFILLEYVEDVIRTPAWYIVDFYIEPWYRRKGYGHKAFGYFLKHFKGDFFYYILKENEPAREFWGSCMKRFGLTEVKRTDIVCPDNLVLHCIERRTETK